MKLSGKTCLVTGGAGFIGSHLVDNLIAHDCLVKVIDNLENGTLENLKKHQQSNRLLFTKGSILDTTLLEELVQNVDVIFHLACLGVRHSLKEPFINHKVNAKGSFLVLEAARKAGTNRFIYCSTSEVYGTARNVPMPEDHPTCPTTIYGASKLAGECYARAYFDTYKFPTTIVRPFNNFGPRSHHEGDAGELIPKNIVRALAGKPLLLFGDGTQTRDFTYVTDTVDALVLTAKNDDLVGETLNIGSGFEIEIKDVLQQIQSLVGNPETKIEHTEERPGDVLRLFADASKFNKLTGWTPKVSFTEGLKKTIEFFKVHPAGLEKLAGGESGINWK